MSVLLAGIEPVLAEELVRRLVSEDDQVRVIVRSDDAAAAAYSAAGAYVARGLLEDDDLVERAAQGVMTIVLGEVSAADTRGVLAGAARAGVDRIVAVAGRTAGAVRGFLEEWDGSYVLLRTGRRRGWGRRTLPPAVVAAAVDAADALPGEPRLDLDLAAPGALAELGLAGPG